MDRDIEHTRFNENDQELFEKDILKRYKFLRIDFNTFSGATESIILDSKNKSS